jgi:Fibrinogen beta and gamma chains, C-terminal globular domain
MTSWASQTVTATYGSFSIGTQSQGWPLYVGNYYGSIPDDLSYSNGRVFYTYDVPDPNNCAVNQRGGWWYNYCSYAFLNGYYYRGGRYTPPSSFYDGIYWKDWLGYDYSLQQVTMAVAHN